MSEETSKKPKMRRGVRILLFASLAINLLVVGLVVGAMASHRYEDRRHPPRLERAGGPLTAALSRQDRRAVGRELREAYREKRPSRESIKAEFGAVITALQSDPYDPASVRAAVAQQMQRITRRADVGMDILLKRFDQMSVAERAAYAERLQKVLERGPVRKPKGRRDGDANWVWPRH